jgi:hypothetical protein
MDYLDEWNPLWRGHSFHSLSRLEGVHPAVRGKSAVTPGLSTISALMLRDEVRAGYSPFSFAGKHVVEIGPGPLGGIAQVVLDAGATQYTGIDAWLPVVERARETGHTYEWGDPIEVIPTLPGEKVIVSFNVDDLILCNDYRKQLVRIITQETMQSAHTYHLGNSVQHTFLPEFQQQGWVLEKENRREICLRRE